MTAFKTRLAQDGFPLTSAALRSSPTQSTAPKAMGLITDFGLSATISRPSKTARKQKTATTRGSFLLKRRIGLTRDKPLPSEYLEIPRHSQEVAVQGVACCREGDGCVLHPVGPEASLYTEFAQVVAGADIYRPEFLLRAGELIPFRHVIGRHIQLLTHMDSGRRRVDVREPVEQWGGNQLAQG